jgi:hypothetical protein
MHLLYVDESGSPDGLTGPFVVGAVAVREDAVDGLRRSVESVVAAHLDPHLHRLELHATQVRGGGGSWRGIPALVRTSIVTDLLALLGKREPARRLFAVVRSPGAVPRADPLERVFEELLLRFSSYLKHQDKKEGRALGLVVADEAKYEAILQPVVRAWREVGTRFGKLTRVTEVPLFVDSSATRLIQLADFVAHGVYRNYNSGDTSWLDALLPAFDSGRGKLHGLTHLTVDPNACACPACKTRRSK